MTDHPDTGEDTGQIDGFSSATEMLQALRQGQLSSVELLDLHLRRIERYNPGLNGIVTPDYENAPRAAAAADHFDELELRTKAEEASGFYQSWGFLPVDRAHATHVLKLGSSQPGGE